MPTIKELTQGPKRKDTVMSEPITELYLVEVFEAIRPRGIDEDGHRTLKTCDHCQKLMSVVTDGWCNWPRSRHLVTSRLEAEKLEVKLVRAEKLRRKALRKYREQHGEEGTNELIWNKPDLDGVDEEYEAPMINIYKIPVTGNTTSR